MKNSQQRLGVEVSRTSLRAVVINQADEIAASRTAECNGDGTAPALLKLIDDLRGEFGEFSHLGIAVPGLVERETGRVAFSTHVPEHAAVDLAKEISSATGLIAAIENDANAAAYGEFKLGSGRGSRNMFYATLGEGVGGAFIFDGEIWRGVSGFAGEFGYVPINSEGMKLEEVASSANIIRRTRSRFYQDSTSSLNKLEEEAITLEEIVAAAEADDDFAQMMLERTGMYVGTAIASVINLLNIERIVVGGEIMKAKHLVLDAIVNRARELAFEPSFNSTTIVEGELGNDAAAVGAALLSGEKK
jgi:glucokinase